MSVVLIASTPIIAHTRNVLPIADELVKSGHRVVWYAGSHFHRDIERVGARPIAPVRATDYDLTPNSPVSVWLRSMSSPTGIRNAFANVFLAQATAQTYDLRSLIDKEHVDVVLCDRLMFAPRLLHAAGGPPWATLGDGPIEEDDVDAPTFGPGWLPAGGLWGRHRNAMVRKVRDHLVFAPLQHQWEQIQSQLNIEVRPSPIEDRISPYLHLQACIPAFEYPRRHWPPQLHWVGALHPIRTDTWHPPSWWAEMVSSDSPVILITQGTMRDDVDELLRPAVRGLTARRFWLIATTGGGSVNSLAELDDTHWPGGGRLEVISHIPYEEVLAHASCMVTNGGYTGVTLAIAHGVPVVQAGRSEEKAEIGARIAWSGAGVQVPLRTQR